MSGYKKLRVIRPCGMDWASMSGDGKTRFCPDCGKNVHNVSAMTSREAARLVDETGSVPCLRGVASADGILMTVGQLATWNRRQFTQTILAAVPFGGLAAAQTAAGTLRGRVTDHFDGPIKGCKVSLTSAGNVRSVESATDGTFSFASLPAGKFALKAECPGFSSFLQPSVIIREDAETQVSFHLDVGTVGGGIEVELKPVKRKLLKELILHK